MALIVVFVALIALLLLLIGLRIIVGLESLVLEAERFKPYTRRGKRRHVQTREGRMR